MGAQANQAGAAQRSTAQSKEKKRKVAVHHDISGAQSSALTMTFALDLTAAASQAPFTAPSRLAAGEAVRKQGAHTAQTAWHICLFH